jgi:hypothetical protein
MDDLVSGSLLVGAVAPIDEDGDEDLSTFLTDLSVTRTARAARRDGGGESVVDLACGVQTPGAYSHVSPTVYGQPETVSSIDGMRSQVPTSVSITRMGVGSDKKYKLFEAPRDSLIGQGTTFYTAENCRISHQGSVYIVSPGDLFVAKTPNSAFADPVSSVKFLTPDLLVEWS